MATIGKDPVWFITGCSTGFGRELAQMVLAGGGRVVATARNPATLTDIVRGREDRTLGLVLDVTKQEQITAAVKAAEQKFGGIDVLVNNAGYGYFATLEDGDEAAYRQLFETNVFGLIAMTKAVLPGMRFRKRGHIVNLSSILGFVGLPSSSFYAATKFAVEGLSEATAADLKPLGISVTVVEPSGFRTDFSGRSLQTQGTQITDYADTAGAMIAYMKQGERKREGDPKRAVAAIIDAVNAIEPPFRLLLGNTAVELARRKLAGVTLEIDRWETLARGADYPAQS